MKKIILNRPDIATMNLGDEIIVESCTREIKALFPNDFLISMSTHTPTSFLSYRKYKNIDFSFVLGSNLLKSTFCGLNRQWNITLRNTLFIEPVILLGAGWWQYNNLPNFYTKLLLNKILNKNFIHSVRDKQTENMLCMMGVTNVLNTGCPTLWKLTRKHCYHIDTSKKKNVVFTLTDYNRDVKKDSMFLNILSNNYNEIFFWPQGFYDLDYLKYLLTNLSNFNKTKLNILGPSLKDYTKFLLNYECDYIGTRLHGGIYALQHKKRTIILKIDNRAEEMQKFCNLPCIARNDLQDLIEKINTSFETNIIIPEDNIKKWKEQFKNDR